MGATGKRAARATCGGRCPEAVRSLYIGLWTGARVPTEQGGHVHTCPECYEHVPCDMACSIEWDLTLDDGTHRGHYHVCDDCRARGAA